jgi:hypothetical protein
MWPPSQIFLRRGQEGTRMRTRREGQRRCPERTGVDGPGRLERSRADTGTREAWSGGDHDERGAVRGGQGG